MIGAIIKYDKNAPPICITSKAQDICVILISFGLTLQKVITSITKIRYGVMNDILLIISCKNIQPIIAIGSIHGFNFCLTFTKFMEQSYGIKLKVELRVKNRKLKIIGIV